MAFEVVQAGAAVVAGILRLLAGAAVLTGARQALVEILVAPENGSDGVKLYRASTLSITTSTMRSSLGY